MIRNKNPDMARSEVEAFGRIPPVAVARSIAPDQALFASLLAEMCQSRRFSNFGPLHRRLQVELKQLLAAKHLGLFANATLALTIAMRALRVTGEVITTPFSFAASAQAIEWAGATPTFVDIDPHHLTIDPDAVEAAITSRTSAILAVHIYGIPCNVSALADIAKRRGLALIFDAAHAFDTRIDGEPIHRFGDATIYSTHASKLFHTGEGGLIVCNDRALHERCERMSNFGFDANSNAQECGINAKMSELHAAIGLSVLPKLPEERAARLTLRASLSTALAKFSTVSEVRIPHSVSDSLQYFAVRVAVPARADLASPASLSSARDQLHNRLNQRGIHSRKYFYPLCNEHTYLNGRAKRARENTPTAEAAAQEVLCLPFHSGVDTRAIDTIVHTIYEGTLSK